MTLVILDSQIFIWGIKLEDNHNQRLDVQRARTLIRSLEDHRRKIVVPTPQLAELLSGCNPEKRQELLALITKRYQVIPFDILAATKFGELLHATLKDTEIRDYFRNKDIYKARMKFDCMIVSSAITRGVRCIYTHDADLARYAMGQIPIKLLSEIPAQLSVDFPEANNITDSDSAV